MYPVKIMYHVASFIAGNVDPDEARLTSFANSPFFRKQYPKYT